MTQLSPEAQKLVDAVKTLYKDEKCAEMGWEMDKSTITVVIRALVNQVVPHEDEAPKAVFDCEPRPSYNFKTKKCDGPLRYDHDDYLRRQFRQEKLDIRWEQRQETRAMMLAIVTELENV